MAVRPIWKGQLRLSLVSIPVEVFTATKSSAKPSFRQIHEPSGKQPTQTCSLLWTSTDLIRLA